MSRIFTFGRDVVRELRRFPVLSAPFVKTDPLRRANRIRKSGLFDLEYYRAQFGKPELTAREGLDHYVRWGHWAGLSVNPLIDDTILRAGLGESGRPAVFEYLWRRAWETQVSTLWNSVAYLERHPEAREHPAGPVGHLWDRIVADPETPVHVRTPLGTRPVPYSQWRARIDDDVAQWTTMDDVRTRRQLDDSFAGTDSLGEWPSSEERPLVSVVLATWNRSGPLRRAVESVLEQSWASWELLIVDDGSWDDTEIVAGVLADLDERITYLRRPHAGVSAARNHGLAAARGAFVTFIDSDNTWRPRFLENMMLGMRENDAPAGFATLESHEGRRTLYRQRPVDRDLLELSNLIDLNTLVVRADAIESIGGFDDSLARAVDYDLVLRLTELGPIVHVPVLGAMYDNTHDRGDRISTSEPMGWNTAVRIKNFIDWDAAAARELAPGTSLVLISHVRDAHLDEKLAEAAHFAQDEDVDVHMYLVTPRPSDWLRARSAAADVERMHVDILGGPAPYSYIVARALTDVAREKVIVIEPSARFSADSLRALSGHVDPAERRMVGPLLVHRDGTVATMGAAFVRPGAAPVDLLTRHPLEDARSLGSVVTVPSLSGRSFAMPTRDLIAVHGIEPLLYNEYELPALALSLRERFGAYEAATVTDITLEHVEIQDDFPMVDHAGSLEVIRARSRSILPDDIESIYARLGLRIAHYRAVTNRTKRYSLTMMGEVDAGGPRTATMRPVHHLLPTVIRERSFATVEGLEVPRLRWAIRIGSPFGPKGEIWGDTHFARSLAGALRDLGQEVVIDHHEVARRPTSYFDDVTLVIRGLDAVAPATAGTSILWIISHPEDVTKREAAAFDHVFAASTRWSRAAGARWELPVSPLLQCTDPALFAPSDAPRTDDIVFVGKSRGVPRTSVVAPVRAGIPVRVFGPEWENILPDEVVESLFVPNSEVSALYGSARIVLNDHWSDMRRDGFVSNRLFDVVASGGRAISDEIEGLEVFEGAVQTFSDGEDLVAKLRAPDASLGFPDEQRLQEISARIRNEHSFKARARTLLATALDHQGFAGGDHFREPATDA